MTLKKILQLALQEDVGPGDITTQTVIQGQKSGEAVIVSKEPGVLAGGEVAREFFKLLEPEIKVVQLLKDGDRFTTGTTLLNIQGKLSSILTGERTALNFLQRLSGIATLTSEFVECVKHTRAKILDTRKTTPGLRELEKYAVRCGGGENHRAGLWDMALIKDNHIKAAGGVKEAISRFKLPDPGFQIEVEVKTLQELRDAIGCQIDRVMLDNMTLQEIRTAVAECRSKNATCKIEVSGGVRLKDVGELAETDVDYISVGALTHSAPSIDMNLTVLDLA
jgi:nicotinate-nucleotide pyrophosphorylase (carboxylating)